jgi:cell division protein FtsW
MEKLVKLDLPLGEVFWPEKRTLFFLMHFLLVIGLLSVYSSTMTLADHPEHYIKRQLLFCLTGYIVYGVGYILGYRNLILKVRYPWLYCIGFLLLPLTPLGFEVNGAKRWIHCLGFSLQPSEFMKIFWILSLTHFIVNAHLDVQKNFFASKPLWIKLGLILTLLLIQPDFGTSFLLTALTLMMLFVARVRLDFYFSMMLAAVLAVMIAIVLAPYRMKRFAAFLDPWTFAQDQGYQLIQSLIALGSGSFFGVGIGASLQKHQALPEAHTDFIFSILVEETGLLGGTILLGIFLWIIFILLERGYAFSKKECYLESYFFIATAVLIFLQTVINLGVCLGLLPTKGLTLPFISYGGSSLWMFMGLLGILDGCWKRYN